MYLFTRQTKLSPGHVGDGMEWAVSVTEKVNQVTSLNVGLWARMLSPGLGTLSWGAAVEHLSDIEDAQTKLSADPLYQDFANRGATMTEGGIDDEVAQFITDAAGGGSNPTHVAVVRSQLANGCFQSGIGAGLEIATMATELSGIQTSFLVSSTGTYGGVGWISGTDSLRALEDGESASNGNPEFLALVDRLSVNFIQGVTTQSIWRRIV